jgi:hypothetical protein
MIAIMLIEMWERLRGYDKWVETQAKIESSNVKRTSHTDRAGNVSYTWSSGDTLVWADSQGDQRRAEFKVDDESPLYQLVGGESVTIRYDPQNPDHFYFRDLLQSRVRRFFQLVLYAMLGLTFFAALLWLNVFTHSK